MILHNEEAELKLDYLRKNNLIILECIVGSQAYGTALPSSDEDKKFIYIEPLESLLSNTITEQLNVTKDFVGYEISRFCELLAKGNPNMLDLLAMPTDCIMYKSTLFTKYFENNVKKFLTKSVETAFGDYANAQINKATGENKKQMSPMEKERKGLLDFCWVTSGQKSIPLKELLATKGLTHPGMYGVQALDHMKNCYNLYIDKKYINGLIQWSKEHENYDFPPNTYFHAHRKYKGVTDKDDVQIVLSSIDKKVKPFCTFYANIEGFSTYCKKYKEFWDWFAAKNETRYLHNITIGEGYDTKNMSHCHRLLDMCIEILRDGAINVRRTNKEELIAIRFGKTPYSKLLEDANNKISFIKELSKNSSLPNEIDKGFISNLLSEIRKEVYNL